MLFVGGSLHFLLSAAPVRAVTAGLFEVQIGLTHLANLKVTCSQSTPLLQTGVTELQLPQDLEGNKHPSVALSVETKTLVPLMRRR